MTIIIIIIMSKYNSTDAVNLQYCANVLSRP